jgi:cell fate regulator YaaT (PSP1 superfamily)
MSPPASRRVYPGGGRFRYHGDKPRGSLVDLILQNGTPMHYIVRHGIMRFLGDFDLAADAVYRHADEVIIETDRGLEIGEVLCEASLRAIGFIEEPTTGRILRLIHAADRVQILESQAREEHAYYRCCDFIHDRQLQMELVDVEHLFGGERLIFYFLAEKRVDFRDLVKDLAREYRTRIEMRQIGVRDEAKLLADYGDCGKPVCCNTHLMVMPPVSMKMAKLQKSTLDPSKISGRCGRLKCCLRYEQSVYEEFQHQLPTAGTRIVTSKGSARVLGQEVLARKLMVEYEDGRRIMINADEVLTVVGSKGP